jgi:hypothetical protein
MYQKVSKFVSNILKATAEEREWRENNELSSLYKIFRRSPEARWILGRTESLRLYKLIKNHKPKNILELGLGIGASAAIMALASDATAKITNMEQYEKCIRIAKKLIPRELQKKINMVYSEPIAFKNDSVSRYQYFSGYKNVPIKNGSFDFILMDGPGGFLENGQLVKVPNGDVINLLPHMAPGCKILIDGRKSAVEMYTRFLSDYLRTIEATRNYTILERTQKPLKSLDELEPKDLNLESRTRKGYFD